MNLFNRKLLFSLFVGITWLFNLSAINAVETSNQASPEKTIKILTIGNSFADNACAYLPQIAESLPGLGVVITKANIGGSSLEKHANLIEECKTDSTLKPYSGKYCLKELLQMDNYDFVTIQQVSKLSFQSGSFQPYAETLIKFIRTYSPQSEIIIHQTWAYNPNSPRLKDWGITRNEMHGGLVESYDALASQYGLKVLRSGEAFYFAYKKNRKINLWKEDHHHANVNGCYLAGCVWLGQLSGISPKHIEFVPGKMKRGTAKFLRNIADKITRNSR
jgi:hypothetical protein